MLENLIILGLMINLICLVIMFPRQQLLASKLFIGVLLSQLAWEWGYLLEIRAESLEQALFWDDLQFLPYLMVSPFWLYLCRALANKPLLEGSGHFIVTLVFPILTFLHVIIGDPLELIRIRESLTWVDGLLTYDFSTLTYLSALWVYGLLITSISILISLQRSLSKQHRSQIYMVLIGIVLPSLGGIPNLLGYTYFGLKDITPFTFALGNLFILYGLLRLHAFEYHLVSQLPILQQLPVGVLILDHQKRVIDWNPLAENMLGMQFQEPGTALDTLPIHSILNLNHTRTWQRDGEHYEIQFNELKTVDKLGSYVITLQNISKLIQQQLSMQETNRQLHTLLEELQDTQTQLLATEKQKSIISLVQSMAHEFNTPLGNLVTLLDGYEHSDDKQEYIPLISSNVERVIGLINKLKALSDLSIDQPPERFLVHDAIDDVVRAKGFDAQGKRVHFEMNVASDVSVYLRRRSFESTLYQLIDNSLQHAFDERLPNPTITITAHPHQRHLQIQYQDNGRGIPQQVVDNLFMPFSDLSNRMSITTGVGLFSVHQWVTQNLQGDIQLESNDQGAAFLIDIPAAIAPG